MAVRDPPPRRGFAHQRGTTGCSSGDVGRRCDCDGLTDQGSGYDHPRSASRVDDRSSRRWVLCGTLPTTSTTYPLARKTDEALELLPLHTPHVLPLHTCSHQCYGMVTVWYSGAMSYCVHVCVCDRSDAVEQTPETAGFQQSGHKLRSEWWTISPSCKSCGGCSVWACFTFPGF